MFLELNQSINQSESEYSSISNSLIASSRGNSSVDLVSCDEVGYLSPCHP